MNKYAIFQHYSKILDTMLKESLFWETYFQRPSSIDDAEGSIDDAAFPENLSMKFGISRGCIVDDYYDYVVKFDIEGDVYGDSLCKREVETYDAAKELNLQKYFTEATYLGTYQRSIQFYDIDKIERHIDWFDYDPDWFDEKFMDNEEKFGEIIPIVISIPLYAYPRATSYDYTYFTEEDEEILQSEAKTINSPLRKRSLQIAMEFIHQYGIEEYEKLTDFLYAKEINDLHRGNIGSINDNLVIIDYAGYWSEYNDEEFTSDEV